MGMRDGSKDHHPQIRQKRTVQKISSKWKFHNRSHFDAFLDENRHISKEDKTKARVVSKIPNTQNKESACILKSVTR